MCSICERTIYPLIQLLVRMTNGKHRWYSVCEDCMQAFEESED